MLSGNLDTLDLPMQIICILQSPEYSGASCTAREIEQH
jgi:hypothetical protein